jgi:hypothetical protein
MTKLQLYVSLLKLNFVRIAISYVDALEILFFLSGI